MSKSHISSAYKYCETDKTSQIENYTTEMFVFVLEYIIRTKASSKITKKILQLFGIENNGQNINIETQKKYNDFKTEKFKPVDQDCAIPDISISFSNDKIIIIEVKVDQVLNLYKNAKGEVFDQIDYYQNIKDVERVYLLSRDEITKNDFKDKLRWRDIYSILKKEDSDYIIEDFKTFLNENGMGEPTPFNLTHDDFLKVIKGFHSLLHEAWARCSFKNYYLSINTFAQESGFGFYIREKNSKETSGGTNYFLGVNPGYEKNITFWVKSVDRNLKEDKKFKIYNKNEYISEDNISLAELSEKNTDEQIRMLAEWLEKIVKPYLD